MLQKPLDKDFGLRYDGVMKLDTTKSNIRDRQRFLDNYNLWLSSLKVGDRVAVRIVGLMPEYDTKVEGVVRVLSGRKMAVAVMMNGLRNLYEFWTVRTPSQGYPRQGEVVLEPHPSNVTILTERLITKLIMKPIKEREYEMDPITGEMRTSED